VYSLAFPSPILIYGLNYDLEYKLFNPVFQELFNVTLVSRGFVNIQTLRKSVFV